MNVTKDNKSKLAEDFLEWATKFDKNIHTYFNDDEWRLIMKVYRKLNKDYILGRK